MTKNDAPQSIDANPPRKDVTSSYDDMLHLIPTVAQHPPDDGSKAYDLILKTRLGFDQDDEAAALEFSQAAVIEARQEKLPLLECAALCQRAIAVAQSGLRDEALADGQAALDIAVQLHDKILEARAFCAIAFVALETHDDSQAQAMLERALVCARIGESDYDQFWALNNLAHIYGDRAEDLKNNGDGRECQAALEHHNQYAVEAIEVANRTKYWIHLCFALLNLANGKFLKGDFEEAQRLVARYSRLARANNSPRLMAYANLDEARLRAVTGHIPDAIDVLMTPEHLDVYCQTDDLKLRTHEALASYHKSQGAFEAAVTHLEAARKLERDVQRAQAARHIRALTAKLQVEEARAEADRLQLAAQELEKRNDALELRRIELERNAAHDPLTGLGNRRASDACMAMCLKDAHEHQIPFCVVYADIDHFKTINDRFGHGAGDRVLEALGSLFAENLRGRDAVFRIGGEEFLILLSDYTMSTGRDVCERLRQVISDHDWSEIDSDLQVTSSFGLSRWTGDHNGAAIIARADAALYVAKNTGRNRIVCG